MIKPIRLIFTFYKSFAFTSILLTLACASVTFKWGLAPFTLLFWFKILSLALIFYYIHSYKSHEYYYYKNLGLSKQFLWISTFILDMILFVLFIILSVKIR